MQKQLSKKSHKMTEGSIDNFMKHIRKYNLQSERYISPKPLLYLYTNPSRHGTLRTLEKSRSKSKTLSNRQSNSKKSSEKTIRQKVQKMLSISKRQNIHKKSVSSFSNKNQKSIKKLNKSTAEIDLTRSKSKIKPKLQDLKFKPQSASGKKIKKTQSKLQEPHIKLIETSPIRTNQFDVGESQLFGTESKKDNPAELIQVYSKKLFKVQLYLQANKNKLGSMLCRKFQQILNQIVESLVQNLKKSLSELQVDIENRLAKQFQKQFNDSMMKKEEEIRTIENVCEKMTKKFGELLHKQHYSTSLIYSLRLRGIDIDNEFGRAVWNVENLGGLGYGKSQELLQHSSQNNASTHRGPIENLHLKHSNKNEESSSDDFEFRQHPNQEKRKYEQFKGEDLQKKEQFKLTGFQMQIVSQKRHKRKDLPQTLQKKNKQDFRARDVLQKQPQKSI